MLRFYIPNMTCGGCASSVSKALQVAAPDAAIEVDLDAKEVSVDGIPDDATVQSAVEGAGFEYGGPA